MALRILGVLRLAFAAVIVVGIVGLIVHNWDSPTFRLLNFFSFFTVESNILAALVLVIAGVAALRGNQTRQLSGLRGAATLYMAITGIVYNVVLADLAESLQTDLPWANFIVHKLIPVVVVLDFLLDRTVHRLGLRNALWWLIFPGLYLVYSLIRGPIVDWYPYPFLDPREHGYAQVALFGLGVAVVFAVMSIAIAYSTRIVNRSEPAQTARVAA